MEGEGWGDAADRGKKGGRQEERQAGWEAGKKGEKEWRKVRRKEKQFYHCEINQEGWLDHQECLSAHWDVIMTGNWDPWAVLCFPISVQMFGNKDETRVFKH